MTTMLRQDRNRNLSNLFAAIIFGAAILVAGASTTLAKDHGPHGRNGRGHEKQGRQVRPAQVRVPQVIAVEHRADYRPYFTGRTYYAPHRHYHAAYRFPVWVNGAVAHRPYAYCDNHLFLTGAVTLPRLAIGFTFGQPGVYVGGYYAAPAPPHPSYFAYEEPRRRHCDHDRDWDDD